MKNYNVFFEEKAVGTAHISEDGLYIRIAATCSGIPEDFYHLYINAGPKRFDLGVCLYKNGKYIWNKKIPQKGIIIGDANFLLQASQVLDESEFISIDPNVPFPYFTKIKLCTYIDRLGQKGIYIKKRH